MAKSTAHARKTRLAITAQRSVSFGSIFGWKFLPAGRPCGHDKGLMPRATKRT